jgi:hypothetical protein
MKLRCLPAAGLLLACFALTATAQKDEKAKKDKVYKTPEAVFDAFLTALNKQDVAALVSCLPAEKIDETATPFIMQGLQRLQIAGDAKADDKLARRWQPTLEALAKHGLTARSTKDLKLKTDADRTKALAAALALVKDRAAFMIDYQQALDREGPRAKGVEVKAKLTGVKIDGDKATGTAVVTEGKQQDKYPVTFVKQSGGWKINPNLPRPGSAPKDKDKPSKKDK